MLCNQCTRLLFGQQELVVVFDWLLFQECPVASHEDESDVWDPMRQAHPPFQGLDMDLDSFTKPDTDTIAGHKFIRGLFLSLHPARCCVN